MRYIIALIFIATVGGCANRSDIKAGMVVVVKRGFYSGCRGTVTDRNAFEYTLRWVDCGSITAERIQVDAGDL